MADERDERQCPEHGCGLELTADELQAHLEWNHNRSEYKAEQLVEKAFADDPDPEWEVLLSNGDRVRADTLEGLWSEALPMFVAMDAQYGDQDLAMTIGRSGTIEPPAYPGEPGVEDLSDDERERLLPLFASSLEKCLTRRGADELLATLDRHEVDADDGPEPIEDGQDCPMCGEPIRDASMVMDEFGGESLEAKKVCTYPDGEHCVIHFDDERVDADVDVATDGEGEVDDGE